MLSMYPARGKSFVNSFFMIILIVVADGMSETVLAYWVYEIKRKKAPESFGVI